MKRYRLAGTNIEFPVLAELELEVTELAFHPQPHTWQVRMPGYETWVLEEAIPPDELPAHNGTKPIALRAARPPTPGLSGPGLCLELVGGAGLVAARAAMERDGPILLARGATVLALVRLTVAPRAFDLARIEIPS